MNFMVLNEDTGHLGYLSLYQKGTYYSRIREFNSLPAQTKDLSHNRNQFKHALKNFFYFHSFYTLDEYFNCNRISNTYYCSAILLCLKSFILIIID